MNICILMCKCLAITILGDKMKNQVLASVYRIIKMTATNADSTRGLYLQFICHKLCWYNVMIFQNGEELLGNFWGLWGSINFPQFSQQLYSWKIQYILKPNGK